MVRIGDATMPPLPPTPGLIDYAHSTAKADRDGHFPVRPLPLLHRPRVGSVAGADELRRPVPATNWVSNVLPVRSRLDRFIPKLIRSDVEDRYLTFRECLEPSVPR